MKRLPIIGLALLAGVSVWLAIGQRRLETRMEALAIENARLTEELAQKPNLSEDQFNAASRRLEKAEAFMNAVESRLTNASALVTRLQTQSQNFATAFDPHRVRDLGGRTRRSPDSPQPDFSSPLREGPRRAPASSHSPEGQLLQRSWGPEQVLGPPNTHEAGDIPTAWAQLSSQGGGNEWLQVNYDRAVDISEIKIRETYNPGAIAKLAAVLPGGEEVVIWEGVAPPTQAPVDTSFSAPAGVQAQSVKVYLDRTRAPGWNEIDAVELIARDGSRQWASSATASTSYADQGR